jgi:hypothetical protein
MRPLAGVQVGRLVALALLAGLSACASFERAAARDPIKCERDRTCAFNERAYDCSTQCVDDEACVERCRVVQVPIGPIGH